MPIREFKKSDFTVGQTVALRYDNNKARYVGRNKYLLSEVTKIGNKILYIGNIKIDMSTGHEKSEYASDYELYLSEEELLERIEFEKMVSKIKSVFNAYGDPDVSFEQVKKIHEIIDTK